MRARAESAETLGIKRSWRAMLLMLLGYRQDSEMQRLLICIISLR